VARLPDVHSFLAFVSDRDQPKDRNKAATPTVALFVDGLHIIATQVKNGFPLIAVKLNRESETTPLPLAHFLEYTKCHPEQPCCASIGSAC
jgi:hypothetical protein